MSLALPHLISSCVCLIVLLSQLWCLGLSGKAGVKVRRMFSVSISKAEFPAHTSLLITAEGDDSGAC